MPEQAPIFELCERCGSEGRLYVSAGFDHDGSPLERDRGECPDCRGEGLICMPGVPQTEWDDCATFDYFDGALDALCTQGHGDASNGMGISMVNDLVYVPGLWRCAKCQFELVQATLNAKDGTVSARDEPGEKCPNCQSSLWRVTERDARQEAQRECIAMWEKGRSAALYQVADFMMSDAETACSWYELSEIIRNDRMGEARTLTEVMRDTHTTPAQAEVGDSRGGRPPRGARGRAPRAP